MSTKILLPRNTNNISILVIDDTIANLRLLVDMLSRSGYQVRPASNGQLALNSAFADPPDLILLDILMPGLSGYEVCARLKANHLTEDIPVIFISALGETLDKVKAFDLGAVDYITKPLQMAEVLARVRTHLEIVQMRRQLEEQNEKLRNEIADRKLAEASLQEYADELTLRNQDLDAFAHTVAHDLRSPLATIIGYAQIIGDAETTLSEDEKSHGLQTIAKFGFKMVSIIDNLLTLAQLRDASDEVEAVDPSVALHAAMERLEHLVSEHNPQFSSVEKWPFIMGKTSWLEEVWVNYLSNAMKYGGTPPVIEAGYAYRPDNYVRLWIKDNGNGLTDEEQSHLFQAFTRLTDVNIKGHGLGLSIVRRIVEKMGGSVGVESTINQGSCFYFDLPLAPLPDNNDED